MRLTTSRPTARLARRWGATAAAGLLAVLLVGCGSDSGSDAASDPAVPASTSADAGAPTSDLPDWAPEILTDGDNNVVGFDFTGTPAPSDELLVDLVTTGDGPKVESGQTITADYLGEVYDGNEPFDSSFSTQPFEAPIGVGSLIKGWDQALVGVPVGSRVLLSIPPELGYGSAGAGAAIPPDSSLYFVIDIIDAK